MAYSLLSSVNSIYGTLVKLDFYSKKKKKRYTNITNDTTTKKCLALALSSSFSFVVYIIHDAIIKERGTLVVDPTRTEKKKWRCYRRRRRRISKSKRGQKNEISRLALIGLSKVIEKNSFGCIGETIYQRA